MVQFLTPSAGPFAPAEEPPEGARTIGPDDRLALTPRGREILELLREQEGA